MQEVTGFIDDGYNVERFIRGEARLYPSVRLTVRVMQPTERSRWSAELSRAGDDDGATEVTTKWMADRITKWDLPAKPTPENVGRLVPNLYDRIFAVIWGRDGGDPLPETGKTGGDQDTDAGNSQPG